MNYLLDQQIIFKEFKNPENKKLF